MGSSSPPKELQGNLDLPAPDHPGDEPFEVSGWLFSRGRKIKALWLCHLSGWTLPLTTGVSRPDVASAFPSEPAALKSGFRCESHVRNGFGTPDFQIRALMEDGAEEVVFQVRFAPPALRKASVVHAGRSGRGLRVLFIDDRLPDPAEGKGDGRAHEILTALLDLGHKVSHARMLYAAGPPAWGTSRANLEILPDQGPTKLIEHLRSNAGHYDCTLISRPPNLKNLQGHLDLLPRPLIYDSEGIWAEMDSMAAAVRGEPWPVEATARKTAAELETARDADVVLAVSPQDAAAFEAAGCTTVLLASHAVETNPGPADFSQRQGMLFFGALEPGTPNVDSIQWFVGQVQPRLRSVAPYQAKLTVIGPGGTPELRSLAGDGVEFLGKQPDLAPFANQARIFVAPTRISAGIPIKLLHAAAMGLPAVATSQLARQLGWKDGEDVLVADSPEEFAQCCSRLMQDEALWLRLRTNALEKVRSSHSRGRLKATVHRALSQCRRVGRPVLLDCGTHYGEGLRHLAEILQVDASWEVHCFEANPACWGHYQRHPLLDIPNLHVHRKAVWTADGTVGVRQENHVASQSGSPVFGTSPIDGWATTVVASNTHAALGAPVDVPCADLSRVVRDVAARASYVVLKLDVEGAEYPILRKMITDGTLAHVNELYIEFHERLLPEESLQSTQQLREQIAIRYPDLRLVERT